MSATVRSVVLASHRWLSAALVLFLIPHLAAAPPSHKRAQARAEFLQAEQLRQKLEARPEGKRRPTEYLTVIRHYERAVELGPAISIADDSVIGAGRMFDEMARLFQDHAYAERAAEKYRFLIQQYPHSQFTREARDALAALAASSTEKPGEKAPDRAIAENRAEAPAGQEPAAPGRIQHVTNIRHWATASYTRVVIELDGPVEYQAGRISNPDRIFFDLHGARLGPALRRQTISGDDGLLKRIRMAQNQVGIARIVLEVGEIRDYSAFLLPNPYRLVVDINGTAPRSVSAAAPPPKPAAGADPRESAEKQELTAIAAASPVSSKPMYERVAPPPAPRKRSAAPPAVDTAPKEEAAVSEASGARETVSRSAATPPPNAETKEAPKEVPKEKEAAAVASAEKVEPPRAARPSSSGQRSLIRALGLKIGKIVIDAGHGGHDTGTIGPTGYMEKDLVLDVAKRLGRLIEDRLGGEVIYTRGDDTFVPLETRTAIANQKQADLFVSIHANSSRDAAARGIETYYLNFTSAQDALEVAARENAVSEKSVHELQDLVKKITLKEKLDESREFAAEVQRSLYSAMSRGNTSVRNRGVKKAPFIVLIGANMPSILAEVSFVSNPTDERLLKKPEYRQKVAEALYRGIQRYANSLAGVKVANSHLKISAE